MNGSLLIRLQLIAFINESKTEAALSINAAAMFTKL